MSTKLTKISPPTSDEYHEYYERYVNKVGENVLSELESQPNELKTLLGKLAPEEETRLHEPYTWTLKQVVGHIIDCERTFATRLFRIAAGDQTPIPGIDQNVFVDNMDYTEVSMKALLKEFKALRKANVLLVQRLDPKALEKVGTASDSHVSAKANLFMMVGHVTYHVEIMKKRLGV